jgi:hypothetical protein
MSTSRSAESSKPFVTLPRNRDALERVLALGPPPFFPGEREAEFFAFAERVVFSAKPADAIEEILVRDVIDLAWEVLRLRRIKVGLLKADMSHGVRSVLATVKYGGDESHWHVGPLTEAWAAGDQRAKTEVQNVLDQAGLSQDEVTAKTVEWALDRFERLDRMMASSEARRNNALREIDRHRGALGAATRRGLDEAEDVEFRDVENGEVVEQLGGAGV